MLGSILLSSSQLIDLTVEFCTGASGGVGVFDNASAFVLFPMVGGSWSTQFALTIPLSPKARVLGQAVALHGKSRLYTSVRSYLN